MATSLPCRSPGNSVRVRRPGDEPTVRCPNCGLLSPPMHGPTHAVMRSSPACWAAFGELLAREFSDPGYFLVHQMTVDSYAASHPGRPERRAIRALGLQLMINSDKTHTIPSGLPSSRVVRWDFDAIVNELERWGPA